jgi:hypothetical protein
VQIKTVHPLRLTLISAFMILGVTGAAAKESMVSPGWAALRFAMLNAAEGDTLTLLPGIFSDDGGVVVKSGVTVRSADGPAVTIVSLEKGTDVGAFLVRDSSSRIIGLTIAHGSWHNGFAGGGISIRNASPLIENNLILGNVNGDIEGTGGYGCGISVEGGAPIIRNNTIVRNGCDYGAIDLYQCSAIVEHNVISENRFEQTRGQGISCDGSPGALIRDNLFWHNGTDVPASCANQIQGSVIADPQFCHTLPSPQDPLAGDWRVLMTSPIAPGGPQAGWGANLGVCPGITPAKIRSWGSVKAMYR